ncbi:MAG: BACON domain-containing protein [Bacteroidales bacterium]|nr:BACON domain-containing protein [Bacteroidales bacterium]MCL2133794.1 BACON domain-containing protein [Bacteroidales bacterium]
MIRKFMCFALCSLAVLAMACSDNDEPITLSVDMGTVNFTAVAGSQTVVITTNTTWTITKESAATWVTVSPTSGSTTRNITITVESNETSPSARSTTLTITPQGASDETIVIAQAASTVSPPPVGGTISGDATNTCPALVVELTTTPLINVDSYVWYKDGTAISGATTTAYTASESGVYTVAGTNIVGTGDQGPGFPVTISACPPPDAAGAISGEDANDCPTTTTVELSIAAVNNAVSYQWYKDGAVISGATTTVYTVTASGTYTVAGVNTSGTGTASAPKVVTITPCGGDGSSIVGTWSAWTWDFFSEDPWEWDETIEAVDATTYKFTNFGDSYFGVLQYYIYEDAEGYYVPNLTASAGVLTTGGATYTAYQQVGAYESRSATGVYMLNGDMPLELSADGNTLKLPDNITVNVGGVPTSMIPAIGTKVIIDGTNYWFDCFGEVVYTRTGSKIGSPTPNNVVKKTLSRTPLGLEAKEAVQTLKLKK